MTFETIWRVDDYRFDGMAFESYDDAVAAAGASRLDDPEKRVKSLLFLPDLEGAPCADACPLPALDALDALASLSKMFEADEGRRDE